MNDIQTSKLKMYMSVKNICVRNQVAWNTVPAFNSSFGSFSTHVEKINALNKQLSNGTKSTTDNKRQLKKTMVDLSMVLVGAIKAYVSVSKDASLAGVSATTASSISSAKDVDADDLCLNIVDKAVSVLPHLADFGTTQAEVDAAKAAITAFADMVGKPKTEILVNKSYNEQVSALFKETDDLLSGQLDAMMLRFKTNNEVFYSEYNSARRIGGFPPPKKDEVKEEVAKEGKK